MAVEIVVEPQPRGTAGAIRGARRRDLALEAISTSPWRHNNRRYRERLAPIAGRTYLDNLLDWLAHFQRQYRPFRAVPSIGLFRISVASLHWSIESSYKTHERPCYGNCGGIFRISSGGSRRSPSRQNAKTLKTYESNVAKRQK
jgi:hypothetical protein